MTIDPTTHTERVSRLQWVPIAEMRVSPLAQREYRPAKAERMAAAFDLEAIGYPVVSVRDGHFYIVDGQHRIGALKLIGYGDQNVECEVYAGLDEAGEARLFRRRNDRTAIRPFDLFKVRITGQDPAACAIDKIVRKEGLRVGQSQEDGTIAAVTALEKVYDKGPDVLCRSLRIIRDSFGGRALKGEVIEGVGLVCHKYNGDLDDQSAIDRLGRLNGGVNGLLHNASLLHKQTGRPRADCVAGAVVEVVNRGRGGKNRLPSWWS